MKNLRADKPEDFNQYGELMDAQLDVTGAKAVLVNTNAERTVLWVNVNGVCLLRVCAIETLDIATRGRRIGHTSNNEEGSKEDCPPAHKHTRNAHRSTTK